MHALLFFLIPGTTNPHPHSGVYTHPPTPAHREGCAHTPTNILSRNLHTYIPKGFLPRACQAPSREGCGISWHYFVINLAQRSALRTLLLSGRKKKAKSIPLLQWFSHRARWKNLWGETNFSGYQQPDIFPLTSHWSLMNISFSLSFVFTVHPPLISSAYGHPRITESKNLEVTYPQPTPNASVSGNPNPLRKEKKSAKVKLPPNRKNPGL